MELILLIVSLLAWILALAGFGGVVDLAGRWDLGLYPYFALAAFTGWLAGNVQVYRARNAAAAVRRGLFVVYFLGPPGLLYLVRAMAPLVRQAEAPLAAVYAWGIFMVFFLVPVSFRVRRSGRGSGRPRK